MEHHQSTALFLTGLLLIAICAVIYVLPIIVALRTKHPHQDGIALLTILGGWTAIGWLIAMIWALTKPSRPTYIDLTRATPEQLKRFLAGL